MELIFWAIICPVNQPNMFVFFFLNLFWRIYSFFVNCTTSHSHACVFRLRLTLCNMTFSSR